MNVAFFLLLTAVGLLIPKVFPRKDSAARRGVRTPLGKLTWPVAMQVLWAFFGTFLGIALLGIAGNAALVFALIAAVIWGLSENRFVLTAAGILLAVSAVLLLFATPNLGTPLNLHLWYSQHANTGLSLEQIVAAFALLILLGSPANAVVAAVLERARRGEVQPNADQPTAGLRGGRLIGVLERYLLVVLASAGLSAAIAALVAAKGVIRFPEISQDAQSNGGGAKAEEFLAGSLTSWSLASLAALLFAAL